MNARDAIGESDLYIGLTEPTYYCENDDCGAPMGYPSVSGLCWDCDRERSTGDDDSTGDERQHHCD